MDFRPQAMASGTWMRRPSNFVVSGTTSRAPSEPSAKPSSPSVSPFVSKAVDEPSAGLASRSSWLRRRDWSRHWLAAVLDRLLVHLHPRELSGTGLLQLLS